MLSKPGLQVTSIMLNDELLIVLEAINRRAELAELESRAARMAKDYLTADVEEWRMEVLKYFASAIDVATTSKIGIVVDNIGDDD